jgi:adenylate kinase
MSRQVACTLFVCGIAGVGKTRLLHDTQDQVPEAIVWRAGEIIAEARSTANPEMSRNLPPEEIQRSQELLISGFNARRRQFPLSLVLLDGHSVIDTEIGLFDIAVDVVERLNPSGIIHVEDDESKILKRRLADLERVRPMRSLEQLIEYQKRSVARCILYQKALAIPLIHVRSGDAANFIDAIRRIHSRAVA